MQRDVGGQDRRKGISAGIDPPLLVFQSDHPSQPRKKDLGMHPPIVRERKPRRIARSQTVGIALGIFESLVDGRKELPDIDNGLLGIEPDCLGIDVAGRGSRPSRHDAIGEPMDSVRRSRIDGELLGLPRLVHRPPREESKG